MLRQRGEYAFGGLVVGANPGVESTTGPRIYWRRLPFVGPAPWLTFVQGDHYSRVQETCDLLRCSCDFPKKLFASWLLLSLATPPVQMPPDRNHSDFSSC